MRKYRVNAGTPTRLDYGLELAEGLALFPETAPLAPSFVSLNEELEKAFEARRALRKPLVKARIKLRFGNYAVDQAIRSCAKAAEIADGGRRGAIFKIAFPDGLAAVVAPSGARQIAPTEALVDRLTKSKAEGIDAFRAEWTPRVTVVLQGLQDADAEHRAAHKAYVSAFGDELALRREHFVAVDKIAGAVRSAFPGDKAKQDVVFPVVEDSADVDAEPAEPAEPADA